MSHEDILALLSSNNHPPYLKRHRATVINTRVRIICLLFAVLILGWIFIDFIFLPEEFAWQLFVLRLVASAIFIVIGLTVSEQGKLHLARTRLMALMLTPLLFYVTVQFLTADIVVEGSANVLLGIYNLLPFLVVAGLAIFPLTAMEALVIGLLNILIMWFGMALSPHFSLAEFLPSAWILLLILGINIIASAIQLHHMASLLHRISRDTLTGAFTRHSGQELIDLHFQLAIEENLPFAIAFLDLDHFKSINDDYGHDAGDIALKNAVTTLRAELRRGDQVVRWGGEEFLLILSDADANGIELILDRIQRHWLGTRPDGNPLTASIGVAERITDKTDDWLALVEIADRRMYQAKTNGRAQAVLFG